MKLIKISDEAHASLLKFTGWRKHCMSENNMQSIASKAILKFTSPRVKK